MTGQPSAQGNPPTPSALALTAALELGEGELAGLLLGLMERVDALLSIKNIVSGRYVHASPGLAALFGRSAEQMVGATDNDVMDAAQALLLRAAEKGALAQFMAQSSPP